ncbi:TFIIH subunit Tfb4/p34 [Dipodascopsis tothii]|uniref:TFIIH subunit Tfb4/p34 n=1 Tax=Dipodascopsis tothii TaxID=44089 RepID=UPI0034CE9C8E
MYRPFKDLDDAVVEQLEALLQRTRADDVAGWPDRALISGALSQALAYANRIINPDNSAALAASAAADMQGTTTTGVGSALGPAMDARILVVNVSSELASQYVAIMNCIFAAQKMHVPVDVCRLGTDDTVFLQQAADTTGGVYIRLDHPRGLVQYLMTAFMPDPSLRKHLVMPAQGSIDFRPACFCHRRIVDIGYVCNVCLSIFCAPPADGACSICYTVFDPAELRDLMRRPVVVSTKRKAKKRKKEP